MSEDGVRNARIDFTFLGIEDHGIFVAEVGMDYGGSAQAFQCIVNTDTVYSTVRAILHSVGVNSWEQLRGKHCRVRIDNGLIRAIGHILEERWTDDDAAERSGQG